MNSPKRERQKPKGIRTAEMIAATDFGPSRMVVLSELPQLEREEWYKLAEREHVHFHKVTGIDKNGEPEIQYVANMRFLTSGVAKKEVMNVYRDHSGFLERSSSPKRTAIHFHEDPGNHCIGKLVPFRGDVVDLSEYRNFAKLITEKAQSDIPATPKMLPWLMRVIEDIYDARYLHDTADLKHEKEDGPETVGQRPQYFFPVFLIEHLNKKYGLKKIVEQTCYDLLFNTHYYRKEILGVEIFARFLQEQYDSDDLLFFLYVRSVIQKVLNVSFKSIWGETARTRNQSQQSLWLSYRECCIVARTVFGDEQDPMCIEFLKIVESRLVGRKRLGTLGKDTRRIEVTQVLYLAVLGYHEARPDDDNEKYGPEGYEVGGQGHQGFYRGQPDESMGSHAHDTHFRSVDIHDRNLNYNNRGENLSDYGEKRADINDINHFQSHDPPSDEYYTGNQEYANHQPSEESQYGSARVESSGVITSGVSSPSNRNIGLDPSQLDQHLENIAYEGSSATDEEHPTLASFKMLYLENLMGNISGLSTIEMQQVKNELEHELHQEVNAQLTNYLQVESLKSVPKEELEAAVSRISKSQEFKSKMDNQVENLMGYYASRFIEKQS